MVETKTNLNNGCRILRGKSFGATFRMGKMSLPYEWMLSSLIGFRNIKPYVKRGGVFDTLKPKIKPDVNAN